MFEGLIIAAIGTLSIYNFLTGYVLEQNNKLLIKEISRIQSKSSKPSKLTR